MAAIAGQQITLDEFNGNYVLVFELVLVATEVEPEPDENGAVVRYVIHSGDPREIERGVYLITENDRIVYVGKYTGTFAARWLYTQLQKIYHHKRNAIADSLKAGNTVRVYVQTEDRLRRMIPLAAADVDSWINVDGIEHALVRILRPEWNRIGANAQGASTRTKDELWDIQE